MAPDVRESKAVEETGLSEEELLQRKRAEEEIRRRSEQLAALNAIAMAVTSTLDLQEVLQAIQEKVMNLLAEKFPPIFSLFNKGDQTFEVVLTYAQEEPLRKAEKLMGVRFEELVLSLSTLKPAVREALLSGKPYVTDDGSEILGPQVSRSLIQGAQRALGVTSIVDLPLWVKGKLVGTMVLLSQKEKISDGEMDLLSAIASQAATAIVNARLYEEAQARSTYLATLLRINATLRSTLPLNQVLETIVQSTAETLGYLGCFVAMPDARGERLTVGAVWGGRIVDAVLKVTPFKLDSFSVPVKVQGNLIARAFATGRLQISSGEPEGLAVGVEPPIGARMARAIERIAGAKGAACVPLCVAEKTVGVLIVMSPRQKLTDEERAMLLGLADQAGLAIENARLYEAEQRRAEELAVLNEIGRAVSSVMQLDDLLELICQEASRVLDTSNLYLALWDAKKNEVSFPLYFEEGERRKPEKRSPRRGITEYVINSAKPLMINRDLVSRLKELNIELIGKPSKSWLGVPMLSEDRAIGVLAIQDYQKENAYDESHLRLLSTIASQAAIAIENARSYQNLKEQNLQTISALAAAVEAKDPYTSGHSEKVTQVAIAIAQKMGLSHDEVEDLRVAALLHDIGKIGIPDSVLNKPARLTPAEFLMVEIHPVIAADIVGNIEALTILCPLSATTMRGGRAQATPMGSKGMRPLSWHESWPSPMGLKP